MGVIRPLQRDDIAAAAALYELVARSTTRTPPPGLVDYFERTFLDYPWADPEIPSLVHAEDDGSITGFLGSSVRRLVFDGRPIRLGVSGQLVTDPGVRSRAVGAFLMKAYMDGPQDLTLTDTASAPVRRIWEGVGGETFSLACMGWVRVFRPARLGADVLERREARSPLTARSAAVVGRRRRRARAPCATRAPAATRAAGRHGSADPCGARGARRRRHTIPTGATRLRGRRVRALAARRDRRDRTPPWSRGWCASEDASGAGTSTSREVR